VSVAYRAPLPTPPDPYLVAWADLRRRQRWDVRAQWAFWICGIPILVAHRLFFVHFWPSPIAWMAPALGVSLATMLRLRAFRCPHCGRRNTWGQQRWMIPQDKCGRCSIRIGTPKSAVAAKDKQAAKNDVA
jgi:hypothetical protein